MHQNNKNDRKDIDLIAFYRDNLIVNINNKRTMLALLPLLLLSMSRLSTNKDFIFVEIATKVKNQNNLFSNLDNDKFKHFDNQFSNLDNSQFS